MRPPSPTSRRHSSAPELASSAESALTAARHGPHAKVMRAMGHQQAHGAIPLQLKGERPAELQGRRKQHGRDDCLSEEFGDRRWITGMCTQLAPGVLQVPPVPAYRLVLKNEATHLVVGNGGWRFHLAWTMGYARGQLNPRGIALTAAQPRSRSAAQPLSRAASRAAAR